MDGVTASVIGPRTLVQLEDLLEATELELSDEDRLALEEPAPPPEMSAGSFWPSPSRVTRISPEASFVPKKSAAAWPWFDRKWNGLASGQPFAASSSRRPVVSLLPSLTKIAS